MTFLLVGLAVGSVALGSLSSLWREVRRIRSHAGPGGETSEPFAEAIPALKFLTIATGIWIVICLGAALQHGILPSHWAPFAAVAVGPGVATFLAQSWWRGRRSTPASD